MENGSDSRSSNKSGDSRSYHTPISQSRQIIISRSSKTMPGPGFRESFRRTMSRTLTLPPGSSSAKATTEVNNILQGRTKEKKDMQELNQRFANYIEKVRFLEAQNRKLATELGGLRDGWGNETEKIKAMYEGELKQLRKLLDESERNKAELEVRNNSLEDRLSEANTDLNEAHEQEKVDKETNDKLNKMMTECEGEINVLRKRVSRFDDERARDRKEIERLRGEVNRLRNDLDNETLAHINAENDCQTAKEELEFLKKIHEAELKELSNLAYRDTTAENRDYWKQELAQAIHDIQDEYDNKLDLLKNELEATYNVKVSEIRTTNSRSNIEISHIKDENNRLKNQLNNLRDRFPDLEARNKQLEAQIAELLRELEELKRDHELERDQLNDELANTRDELEQVLDELQHLLDAKLSLELEIVAYRKLLEVEEARTDKKKKEDRSKLILPPKKPTDEKPVEEVVVPKSESGVKSSPKAGDAGTDVTPATDRSDAIKLPEKTHEIKKPRSRSSSHSSSSSSSSSSDEEKKKKKAEEPKAEEKKAEEKKAEAQNKPQTNAKPADAKPADAKLADAKPADTKSPTTPTTPGDSKLAHTSDHKHTPPSPSANRGAPVSKSPGSKPQQQQQQQPLKKK